MIHQPPVARHACTRASYLAKFFACSSAPQTVLAKNRHATGRRKALKPSCLAKRDICAVPSLPPYSWRGGTMEFIVHVPYISFSSFRNRNWVETDYFILGEVNTDIVVAAKVEAGHVDAFLGDPSGRIVNAHSNQYGGKKSSIQHIVT